MSICWRVWACEQQVTGLDQLGETHTRQAMIEPGRHVRVIGTHTVTKRATGR
jgi:hypothetical protein